MVKNLQQRPHSDEPYFQSLIDFVHRSFHFVYSGRAASAKAARCPVNSLYQGISKLTIDEMKDQPRSWSFSLLLGGANMVEGYDCLSIGGGYEYGKD